MKDNDIRLTREEWEIVEEQCKDCQFWNSTGCVHPDAGWPEPVPDCPCFHRIREKMDNKVVVEIETDLETLSNADYHARASTVDFARMKLTDAILDALSPEDKIRLEKYQKGE